MIQVTDTPPLSHQSSTSISFVVIPTLLTLGPSAPVYETSMLFRPKKHKTFLGVVKELNDPKFWF